MKNPEYSLDDLIHLMRRLRDPQTGCPWDVKQNYRSIAPSTIEEAYEVVDAIEREDFQHLREELGDLLFQVVFYAQLANEEKRFSFYDIIHELTAKLVRRHPHVFPQGTLHSERSKWEQLDESRIGAAWEAIKQSERDQKGSQGVFDDIPVSLPSLARAVKLQKRAAKLGFDWRESAHVVEKVREEVCELEQAFDECDADAVSGELGDLMFSCVNLARHLGCDPDSLVRRANRKFERRFRHVESQIRQSGRENYTLEELESFWRQAKSEERTQRE